MPADSANDSSNSSPPRAFVSIVLPACVAGLCAYIPVAGIRGALFCLFPAIAFRTKRRMSSGLVFGFVCDIAFEVIWLTFGFIWEPRDSYNRILTQYLPPAHNVVAGAQGGVSNGFQFGLGLTAWTTVMFVVWCHAWPIRTRFTAFALPLAIGVASTGCVAAILWRVTPLNHWWSRGQSSSTAIDSVWWLVAFLAAMPLCCVVEGLSLRWFTARPPFSLKSLPIVGEWVLDQPLDSPSATKLDRG